MRKRAPREYVPLTDAWTPLVFHGVRVKAAACTKRFVGIVAGRGSGKTEIAKRRLVVALRDCTARPGGRYFYAAPTQEQAERIAWDDLLRLIPRNWISPDVGGEVSLSESKITTRWGTSVQVVGLDKPQRIEGVQWDGGMVDESCDIRPGAFNLSIMPALITREGWAWRLGIPKRNGIGSAEFKEWCDEGATGRIRDRACFHWNAEDILDRINPGRLEFLRDSLPPRDYAEQVRASWVTAGGVIFYAFASERNVKPCDYAPSAPLLVGCDFNVDPMCWVVAQLRGTEAAPHLEFIDEFFVRNTHTRAMLDVFLSRWGKHRAGFRWFLDAASGQRSTRSSSTDYATIHNDTRLQKAGSFILFPRVAADGKLSANPPLDARFESCNATFLTQSGTVRAYVAPHCKHLIRDLESRFYRPGTREPGDKKDLGHISDAAGYLIHELFPHMIRDDRDSVVIVAGA